MLPIKKKAMWTREEAFKIIPALEMLLASHGAHVGLAGSVLYRGTSDKDLDLIIYPHNKDTQHWNTYELKKVIRDFFGAKIFNDCKGVSQMRDGKEVSWLTSQNGLRVDLFFLS